MTGRALRRAAGAGLLALACVLPGPAAEAQDVDALRQRLAAIDAELDSIRARIGGGAPGASGAGELSVRLDRLEIEISRLTGRVEELAHRQRLMAEDAARRLGDIDFRLTELEGGDVTALAPQPPLGDIGAAADAPAAQPAPPASDRKSVV